MGTLSKRRPEDFGIDVKGHVERFRSTLGQKPEELDEEELEQPTGEGPLKTAWLTWLTYAGAAVVLIGITSRLVRLAIARATE